MLFYDSRARYTRLQTASANTHPHRWRGRWWIRTYLTVIFEKRQFLSSYNSLFVTAQNGIFLFFIHDVDVCENLWSPAPLRCRKFFIGISELQHSRPALRVRALHTTNAQCTLRRESKSEAFPCKAVDIGREAKSAIREWWRISISTDKITI